jgi:hypothetical protein
VKAEASERLAAEQARQREHEELERRVKAERTEAYRRLVASEMTVMLRTMRAAKPEKLRVLILGAASAGDLRVSREQARIRTAVERSLHRDLVEIDAHPAARTTCWMVSPASVLMLCTSLATARPT